MNQNYILTYGSLLKKTVSGAKLRAFFFGYNSKSLDDYLSAQKQKIWATQDAAYRTNQPINTQKNCDLAAELFGLEVKVESAKLGFLF